MSRKFLPALLLGFVGSMAARTGTAQTPASPVSFPQGMPVRAASAPGGADDATRRQLEFQNQQIEMQRRQIEALERRFDSLGPQGSPSNVQATGYLAEQEAKKKEDALKEKVAEVGKDLTITTRWNPANGVTFETPNKDFVSHIGVRFQYDTVWFQEDAALSDPAQVGDLQDGTFFRRMRPSWDGTAYEVIEWNVELALEQVSQGIPNLDEVWVGVTQIPLVGSIRVGHLKVPQGFEGDMVSSSKAMTFMERAAYTDAFYENFASGVWAGNSVLDQRATWSSMAYRQDNALHGNNGADFGDGKYGYSGRLTGLPLYTDDGRHLMHLGVSGTWRAAENPDPGTLGPGVVRFRARPEMRDAIGDFGSTIFPATTLPGNSRRMVDTGTFNADSTSVWGTEFFYVRGPFSVQAEYAWVIANDPVVGGVPQGALGFNGGYVQLSYFLTGENRVYDRRLGRLGSTYIKNPYTPFFFTRSVDGGTCWGSGAWELAARWSHLNLNDGVIQGGETDGLELGLNWYLTNNLKVQFEYLHQNRYHMGTGQLPGDIDAFGTRTQFFF